MTSAIQIQPIIEKMATILELPAHGLISATPPTPPNLVTKIHRNKPPVVQSALTGIIPYITIFESDHPLREVAVKGRDTRDVEGPRLYELEIYTVIVTESKLSSEDAQKEVLSLSQKVRDAYGRHMRLTDAGTAVNPLCATHTRFQIPYVLSLNNPNIRAMNVVLRPQIYTSLRG